MLYGAAGLRRQGSAEAEAVAKAKAEEKEPLSDVASSSEPAAKNKNSAESGVLAVEIEELRTLNKLQQEENETNKLLRTRLEDVRSQT